MDGVRLFTLDLSLPVDPHDVHGLGLPQRPQLAVLAHPVADPVGSYLAHNVLVLLLENGVVLKGGKVMS